MHYSHPTVLKQEAITWLAWNPHGLYIDATCGGGGHSEELLQRFPEAELIACDWDLNALKATEKRLEPYQDRVTLCQSNFGNLRRTLNKLKVEQVDGILVDFGTSRNQIVHTPGLSFLHDTPLDMRLATGYSTITAADIVAKASEKELITIFREYGEERYANKIARAIYEERKERPIVTTLHLAHLVEKSVPRSNKKIHPATQVFQALRIAVNKELDEIKSLLHHAYDLVSPQGRLVCISFHSLEDRLVKHFIRAHKTKWNDLSKGAIIPSDEEIDQNRASRSAKMRVAEKLS